MIYITGDIHGYQLLLNICLTNVLKANDILIVAGDFGIGFFNEKYVSENEFFDLIEKLPYTVLFVDGNHEDFTRLNNHKIENWNGGRVHFVRKNIIHLMRGELYYLEGKRILTFGGGFSIDRGRRILGQTWWKEEMPCEEERKNAVNNIIKCKCKVDYIITHTAPTETIEYLKNSGVISDVFEEEKPLTDFLQWIEGAVRYDKWYFAHVHNDCTLWKKQKAIFNGVYELETGKMVAKRQ